jgi:hypothetical protein
MFLGFQKRKDVKKQPEKTEGIDECTRQIIAANMTMLVSISGMLYDIKQIELERGKQFEELKALIKKED